MPTPNGSLLGTRILGVDPGLRVTGYGVVEVGLSGPIICEAGVLRGEGNEIPERVAELFDGLVEVLEQFHPQVMVVEQLYSHYAHPRTAILMAHARGAILLAAAQRALATVSYSASRIKKILTGSGRAPKDQVQRVIQREFGLPRLPDPPDVADALAAALCHYYVRRSPSDDKVTR